MKTISRAGVALAAGLAIAGCTSGNSAIAPAFQSNNISTQGKLQFVVGTANIATPSTPYLGLNTVVTFRQANGLSAFALDNPTIVGPSGFTVPAAAASTNDAGTGTIGPNTFGGTGAASGQATSYGFGPNNYGSDGSANFGQYPLPFFCEVLGVDSNSACTYVPVAFSGLPPAFPLSQIAGFTGYNPGFVDFAAPPVSGSYALSVLVPTSPGSSQAPFTYHAAATLNAAKVLPPLAPPTFVDDGKGGGPVTVGAFPAGVVSELVEVASAGGAGVATFNFTAPGTQTLPDGTLTSTSSYLFVGVGFDYNWFAAAPPANSQQTPALPAQADITVSPEVAVTALSNGRRVVVPVKSIRRKH